MFSNWFRILKPGGRVVIEVAEFLEIRSLAVPLEESNRQLARNQFYGSVDCIKLRKSSLRLEQDGGRKDLVGTAIQ